MAAEPTDTRPSQVLLYQADEGAFRLEVPTDGDTVWLSLDQMARLFDRDKSTVSRHVSNIFDEGELQRDAVVAKYATTAAEVIHTRADASRPSMGVTNFPGKSLLKRDTEVAKNYLDHEELNLLNRIVTAYLELAELQAMNRVAMTMTDWLGRLRDFLTMTGREILDHAGVISRDEALCKAHQEYENYKSHQLEAPSDAERHFLEQTEKELKALEKRRKDQQG